MFRTEVSETVCLNKSHNELVSHLGWIKFAIFHWDEVLTLIDFLLLEMVKAVISSDNQKVTEATIPLKRVNILIKMSIHKTIFYFMKLLERSISLVFNWSPGCAWPPKPLWLEVLTSWGHPPPPSCVVTEASGRECGHSDLETPSD